MDNKYTFQAEGIVTKKGGDTYGFTLDTRFWSSYRYYRIEAYGNRT